MVMSQEENKGVERRGDMNLCRDFLQINETSDILDTLHVKKPPPSEWLQGFASPTPHSETTMSKSVTAFPSSLLCSLALRNIKRMDELYDSPCVLLISPTELRGGGIFVFLVSCSIPIP